MNIVYDKLKHPEWFFLCENIFLMFKKPHNLWVLFLEFLYFVEQSNFLIFWAYPSYLLEKMEKNVYYL